MLERGLPVWGKIPIIKGLAETERFELSVPYSQHDGLANRWFQPLTHVSGSQQRGRAIAGVWEGGKGVRCFSFTRLIVRIRCGPQAPVLA